MLRCCIITEREKNIRGTSILILSLLFVPFIFVSVNVVGVNAPLLCPQGANILLKLGRTRKVKIRVTRVFMGCIKRITLRLKNLRIFFFLSSLFPPL